MTTPTMRERLIEKAADELFEAVTGRLAEFEFVTDHEQERIDATAQKIVDAILAELKAEADREPDQSHEGMIYEMARAIGLADSGTDLESIASGRGSYVTYTECAKAGLTAMIDAIRGERT